jgi:hypothetical protein
MTLNEAWDRPRLMSGVGLLYCAAGWADAPWCYFCGVIVCATVLPWCMASAKEGIAQTAAAFRLNGFHPIEFFMILAREFIALAIVVALLGIAVFQLFLTAYKAQIIH